MICVYVYIYIYIHMLMCMYVYIYIYIKELVAELLGLGANPEARGSDLDEIRPPAAIQR